MKRCFAPAVGALGCGLLLVFGCGGSSFTEDSQSSSGSAAGGQSAGTSGSSTSGGSETAGTSSGGTSSGGSETAGTSSGGSETAGATTGGTSSGGETTGGSATGGGMTTGGSSTGGASTSCNEDADCTDCAYPTAPQTIKDCYCATCATTPMSKASCAANQAQYAKVCADVHLPCPAIACVMPAVPVCKSHMCVAAQ